jgi:outer membrane protein OmpA-like peptidoglycan-associated protein/opacity protein-like surface antigen
MNRAARLIATTGIAFLLVPTLFADDTTKPKAKGKDEAATSGNAPSTSDASGGSGAPNLSSAAYNLPTDAQPQPQAGAALPVNTVANSPAPPQDHAGSVGAMHPGDDTQGYTPNVEWFLGYSFWRATPASNGNRISYLHGGSTSVAYNFNKYVGLVADFAGLDDNKLTLFSPGLTETVNSGGSVYTLMIGPRLSYRKYEKFTPYIQALGGVVHASSVTISGCTGDPRCTPIGSDATFVAMAGAGFDINISHRIALRLLEADFLLTHFRDPISATGFSRGWQDNTRLSTGIVFRFGGNPPPPSAPLGASCSANPEMVYAGSGDWIAVRADASNSANYPLNYFWSASEGGLDGSGPNVRWNSLDRHPGTYTISLRLENGRNGAANCSVAVRVAPRPNRPPTISCSADRNTVIVGDPVQITAIASDLDNDPLTFSWSASGGRLEGTGTSVQFHTRDVSPGAYAITGHVDDGRSGTADCAVNIYVQAPPPPEIKELETRLALHSIYFPTARPTEANPEGGLLESQRQVLLALAADFSRYLTFKPDADLTLVGHADHRGAVEYNQKLTERRANRTKDFLVEHGVPAANIETRALGEQDNLTTEQVKQLVDENPDLTPEERDRINRHLQIIVWANNRRVDVSLSTTGQQSVRQYPFNAKDALALLSTKGGESEKSSTPAISNKNIHP